jgi:hypothetical protein
VNHPSRYYAVHQPTITKTRSPAEAAGQKQDSELARSRSDRDLATEHSFSRALDDIPTNR